MRYDLLKMSLFLLIAILSKAGAQTPDTVWCQKVGQVNVVKFTPDGNYVIAGVNDGIARMYDAKNGTLIKSFPLVKGTIDDMDISPTGDTLAICDGYGLVSFFNVQTGTFIRYLYPTNQPGASDISFSPDGKYMLSNDFLHGVYVKNLETDSVVFYKTGSNYFHVKYSPRGDYFIASVDSMNTFHYIEVFRTEKSGGWGSVGFIPLSDWINQIAFSPDGNYLAVACDYEPVTVWSVVDRSLYKTFNYGLSARSVAFSPDNKKVISGIGDVRNWHFNIWDIQTSNLEYSYLCNYFYQITLAPTTISCSPDMSMIATGCSEGIVMLNLKTTSVHNPINVSQNTVYPNPSSNIANISYGITVPGLVNITIYDNNSNVITTLLNQFQDVGNYTIPWNVANVANGAYYCVISLNNFSSTLTIVVNK